MMRRYLLILSLMLILDTRGLRIFKILILLWAWVIYRVSLLILSLMLILDTRGLGIFKI